MNIKYKFGSLKLTPNHVVFLSNGKHITARDLVLGDELVSENNNGGLKVESIDRVNFENVINVMTPTGQYLAAASADSDSFILVSHWTVQLPTNIFPVEAMEKIIYLQKELGQVNFVEKLGFILLSIKPSFEASGDLFVLFVHSMFTFYVIIVHHVNFILNIALVILVFLLVRSRIRKSKRH